MRTTYACLLGLLLVTSACDDGGGEETDAGSEPMDDAGSVTSMDDAGSDPMVDADTEPQPDASAPSCDSLACVNGTCVIEGSDPVCVCEPGWAGETCDSLDAPNAADTVLWLDAARVDSFTFDEDKVIRWADLSPSGADFTSETAATRPFVGTGIGTQPAVSFDGVDDYLVSDGYTGLTGELRYTMFFIVSNGADNNILSGYTSGGDERIRFSDSNSGIGLVYSHTVPAGGSSTFSTAEAYEPGEVHLVTVQRTNEEMSIWIDGGHRIVLAPNQPEALPEGLDLILGDDADHPATSALSGKIGEIIVFPSDLDLEDRRRVESYLAAKWLDEPPAHDASAFGNVMLWLDASDTDNVLVMEGVVPVWTSRVGTDLNFAQETDTRRPAFVENALNGLPVIRFDGVDDKLIELNSTLLSSGEYTIALVGASSNTDNAPFFTAVNGSNLRGIEMISTAGGESFRFTHTWPANLSTHSVSVAGGATATPIVAIATWDGTEATLMTDYATNSVGNSQDPVHEARLTLGSMRPDGVDIGNLEGDIAEFIIFRRALTSAERSRLMELLSAKWGLGR